MEIRKERIYCIMDEEITSKERMYKKSIKDRSPRGVQIYRGCYGKKRGS